MISLYRVPFVLIKSRFVARINRFVVEVELAGKRTKAYLPNPGRLATILIPGRLLLLKKKQSGKYRYEVFAAKLDGAYATLDPRLANLLFAQAIELGALPYFRGFEIARREPQTRAGRLDFELRRDRERHLVEVKSCTHVEQGIAKFPDRPTERGRRHLAFLMKRRNAHLVIVVQRPDADRFAPYAEIDPLFAQLFDRARRGGLDVRVLVTAFIPPNIFLKAASLRIL